MTTAAVLSEQRCRLGEGPLWHPERGSLLWVDILGQRLYERRGATERHWQFDRPVSAAGWVDRDRLLLASARDLCLFDLASGTEESLVPLEAEQPETRSNDGRADPQGGFWIGTMGHGGEPGRGAIYRYYRGSLRRLYEGLSIPNAICFAPDGGSACFADTAQGIVRRVALDAQGWPRGPAEDWLDLRAEGLNPDGAVIDAEGRLWLALWGAGRVACHDAAGALLHSHALPTPQTTCPAFGGPDLDRLFVTSAAEGRPPQDGHAGQVFELAPRVRGQAEHRVRL